ncbi:MAG: glycoside hydrolase family 88 protein [Bacteroidales bacterium]
MKKLSFLSLAGLLILAACKQQACPDPVEWLRYSQSRVEQTLKNFPDSTILPRSFPADWEHWQGRDIYDWTSGFFPGMLWYAYEFSGDSMLLEKARHWTSKLEPIRHWKDRNHDLGFMMFCSYGNGLRLTGDTSYIPILLETADSLAVMFNPHAGTILSWPWQAKNRGWKHNTIIDNMMNLELLFWAAKNGRPAYYDIAVKHAQTTRKNHIRADFSTYHVLVYDSLTGAVDSALTHQGYANSSMWARGQAWAINGFTMTYRETKDKVFLKTAIGLADKFISELPADHVPYWDFNAPAIPDEPRDASAAAIAASALLDLSGFVEDPGLKEKYKNEACTILAELCKGYIAAPETDAILAHSVGSKPHNSEVDYSIIYADYYFMEALLKLNKSGQ